jgi:hypothetical protein
MVVLSKWVGACLAETIVFFPVLLVATGPSFHTTECYLSHLRNRQKRSPKATGILICFACLYAFVGM